MPESTSAERDPLTNAIIGAAIEVHRNLGPGLLECAGEQMQNLMWALNGVYDRVETWGFVRRRLRA